MMYTPTDMRLKQRAEARTVSKKISTTLMRLGSAVCNH